LSLRQREGQEQFIGLSEASRLCFRKEWVNAFKEREAEIPFTDEEIDMILGGTARKVLKL